MINIYPSSLNGINLAFANGTDRANAVTRFTEFSTNSAYSFETGQNVFIIAEP